MGQKCYYDNEYCEGELWECQTCHEHYCEGHWHETDKGENVECVACERQRTDDADDAAWQDQFIQNDYES